jgi:hypothetical protein
VAQILADRWVAHGLDGRRVSAGNDDHGRVGDVAEGLVGGDGERSVGGHGLEPLGHHHRQASVLLAGDVEAELHVMPLCRCFAALSRNAVANRLLRQMWPPAQPSSA